MLKWAAISDTPPFTEPVEFEFDERVNVFIGPNATGKSTLLRKLAGAKYDLTGGKRPKFAFDLFAGNSRIERVAPHADLLREPFETSLQKWEALARMADDVPRMLPMVYVPAARISIPLSSDTEGIREILAAGIERHDLAEILKDSGLTNYFDSSVVYHAAKVTKEGLQSGRASKAVLSHMLKAARISYQCAQAICSDVLAPGGRQYDWIQDIPVELIQEDYTISAIHHDMAVKTAVDSHSENVFVGDLSAGTQGTLLWIWYLALQIANVSTWRSHDRRRPPVSRWERFPAILLIDEIENHLHPSWQRRVIPALLKYFPGLQIFATTHSPFVIAGLEAGQVHLLSRNDDGTVVASTNEQDIVGWTADEILRTFMGVEDPTDEMTATNAARLRVLRRKDALEGLDDDEQAELDVLRTKAGADILAQGGMLNAQRERFADMVQDFLKARLTDTPPNEGQA